MSCAVDGCHRPAEEPELAYNHARVRLCAEHRGDFEVAPHLWDGELDPEGEHAVRIWHRQGVGDAS
jgi:hypothetical protein